VSQPCTVSGTRKIYFVWDPSSISSNCTFPPPDPILSYPCSHLVTGSLLSYIVILVTVVVVLVSLFLLHWVRSNKNHDVVKMSQPIFCQVFLFGCLMSGLVNLLYLGASTTFICR